MRWVVRHIDWAILAFAGIVITLDWILPSWLTGSMDELLLGGLVALMRVTRRFWSK